MKNARRISHFMSYHSTIFFSAFALPSFFLVQAILQKLKNKASKRVERKKNTKSRDGQVVFVVRPDEYNKKKTFLPMVTFLVATKGLHMRVCPSVGWSVRPIVRNLFFLRPTRSDLCRVYGLVYSLTSEKRTGRRIDGSTDRRID